MDVEMIVLAVALVAGMAAVAIVLALIGAPHA